MKSIQPNQFLAMSDAEFQLIVERIILPERSLQELVLVLIPERLLSLSEELRLQVPSIQQSLQEWFRLAHLDDERLRIERSKIPHTLVYVPDTPKGRQFFRIAKSIGEVALNLPIIPKNQNQAYWLKTLHYFRQARGIALAHKLTGAIPDPLEAGGALYDRLPKSSLKNLRLIREIDFTCFQILARGQQIIRQWAEQNEITYPFDKPIELFLEITQQEFFIDWQLGPSSSDWQWLPKQVKRDYISTRIYLLREGIWQDCVPKSAANRKTKEDYLEYLQAAGWESYWILAMQSQIQNSSSKHLEPYLWAYLDALTKGKELVLQDFDWRGGQPYKNRINGDRITNSPQQVQGGLNLVGYITWYRA